jgi:hypothetical protein
MEKTKRTIELLANNTGGALELKKSLEKKGLEVIHIYTGIDTPMVIDNGKFYSGLGNVIHIYTGIDTPMVIDNGKFYSGLGNIRVMYGLYK